MSEPTPSTDRPRHGEADSETGTSETESDDDTGLGDGLVGSVAGTATDVVLAAVGAVADAF